MAELSNNDITTLRRLVAWARKFKITGPNVRGANSPELGASYHIGAAKGGGERANSDFAGYFAVTSATQDGTNKRWAYTMAPHEKSAAGYAGWTAVSGGTAITARNDQEEDNGATGLMGNGVTLNGSGVIQGTSYTVGPLPIARGVHRVYRVAAADGTVEYWLSAANPLTGSC